MRKKIPTITQPDPAYAAALRHAAADDAGREEAERAGTAPKPVSLTDARVDGDQAPQPSRPSVPPPLPSPETAAGTTTPATVAPRRVRHIPATRKIDIRVNALERQEEALIDCGVDPAHVIRAALRRAVRNWQLGPEFVPPSEEQRTRITEWRARTSLAVDTAELLALLRAHDPLDVLSKWALIRGQLEPRVWGEIDAILTELGQEPILPDTSTACR